MLRVAVCLLFALGSLAHRHPEVRTSQGAVRGRQFRSRDSRQYYSFSRIPYGQPPVGELRFKAPVPAKPWHGVLDGTTPGPKCPQRPDNDLIGQEDCLYLDVITPNISASLPVLVHIYGGSFLIGPELFEAGPEFGAFFMDENVVLVTLRYRLGILGFLSMENEELPGNYGLKDMALALDWVKRDIHNFGGNPDLISTFGVSAGGAATHYLCLAPRTRRLLKGCISGSGVAGSKWSLNKKGDAIAVAKGAAKKFGCPEKQLASCLRGKPLTDIIQPYAEILTAGYNPSIEPPSREAMITEWPPKDTNFPWVLGHTANEGILTTGLLANFENETALKPYLEDYETYFPEILHLKYNKKQKARRIYDRFFRKLDPYTAIEQFISEALFEYPALKEAARHTGPKYFYLFNYTGGPSMWEMVVNRELNITGVAHCDEMPYLFNLPDVYKPKGWPSQKDIEFSKILVKRWVNFAKKQNPNVRHKVEWKQFNRGQYLDLANAEIKMKQYKKMDEILSFWDSILDE